MLIRYRNLLLLDGGWTTKSPADGNKSLSLPKSICSQEVVSSCLGKDLSAWRRSPISGTDYSGRDHITVKYCFCQQMGDSVILRLTEWAEGLYRAVKFARMIIETSMSSQNLSGRSKVSPIHPD